MPATQSLDAVGAGGTAGTATSTTATSFVAAAVGDVDGDTEIDRWTINENKTINNYGGEIH
jgi:hypothetical protein